MAFYFALLNVSSRKEEKHPKVRRRRHSIASVDSPLLDYRLLPRPQVVTKDLLQDEQTGSEEQEQRVRRRSKNRQDGKVMRKSESSYITLKKSESRERGGETPGRHKFPSEPDPNSGRIPETSTDKPSSSSRQFHNKTHEISIVSEPISTRFDKAEAELANDDRQKRKSDKRSKSTDKGSTKLSATNKCSTIGNLVVQTSPYGQAEAIKSARRGKGGRPLVVKRRISPTESTTSGSRRSSKESQRSLPPRDSPVSSICSNKDADIRHSLLSPSQNSQKPQEKPVIDPQRLPQLKKVTFESVNSPYIINGPFLGERAVLVRRLSGCETVLRTSTSIQTEKVVIPQSGAEWLKRLEGRNRGKDSTVPIIEVSDEHKPVKSCLLRRRSTSDRRHVILSYGSSDATQGLMTLSVDRPQNL